MLDGPLPPVAADRLIVENAHHIRDVREEGGRVGLEVDHLYSSATCLSGALSPWPGRISVMPGSAIRRWMDA